MRLPVAQRDEALRKMWALMREDKRTFIKVLALQVCVAVLGIITPFVVGSVVDGISQGATASFVRNAIIFVWVVTVVQAIVTYYGTLEATIFSERMLARLRERVVWAVTHLPLGMVERVGSGDMIGRTTNDVERIQFFIQNGLSRMTMVVFSLGFTVIALIVNAPLLGGLATLSAVPVFFIIRWYLRRTIPAYHAVSASQAGLAGMVSETIEQNDTVDAMRMGPSRSRRADVIIREIWNNEMYTGWTRSFFIGMMQLFICIPVFVTVGVGILMLDNSASLTIGAMTASALYAMQMRNPLMEIGWWVDELQFAAVSLARVFGAESAYEGRQGDQEITASPEGSTVEIRDVRFSYDDGEEVLRGLSMVVEPGQTLAIVGPSGAGKSTLGRLIAGVNAPSAGSVRIGGAEVSQIPEHRLHSTVAMVTQEHHVFVGTIAENLSLAKPDATREEMLEALSCVNASWVESLEEGLDTKVGSGFLVLTPPQAQQLALARMVLVDPDVLVLDEATSLLDSNAARTIELSLGKVLEGRTVISIAHRLYTAHDADKVAIIMDGEVVECGSHDELIQLGGEYAKLWESWQRK